MSNVFRPNGLYTFCYILPMGAGLIVYYFGCGLTRALSEIIAFSCRASLFVRERYLKQNVMCCLLEKISAICPEGKMNYFRRNCPSMAFKVRELDTRELYCSLCLLDLLIGEIETGIEACERNELIDMYVNRLEVMERLRMRRIWLQEDAPKVEKLLYGV